jgi:hypothetical protein
MAANVEVWGGWRLTCGGWRTAALGQQSSCWSALEKPAARATPRARRTGRGGARQAGRSSAGCGSPADCRGGDPASRRGGMWLAFARTPFTVHTGLAECQAEY